MTATARGSHRLVAIRRKGDGVAGGKAAKFVIVDMLGGESDGREGGCALLDSLPSFLPRLAPSNSTLCHDTRRF